MRLSLCAPDARDVAEAIGQFFSELGARVHLCDHRVPLSTRLSLAERFSPDLGLFYLPMYQGEEVQEGIWLTRRGAVVICLVTDRRRQSRTALEMGASKLLDCPCDIDMLERAVYGHDDFPMLSP